MQIAKGKLADWVNIGLRPEIEEHWVEKIKNEHPESDDAQVRNFLKKIRFEHHSIIALKEKSLQALISSFGVNEGTEDQYFAALIFHVFEWSKQRAKISSNDIQKVITSVWDALSKHPTNLAIANSWITSVIYDSDGAGDDYYYAGTAARPKHIAMQLPVRRTSLEREVKKTIDETDVTVIIAASGEGKSTLAWQVCFNLIDAGRTIYQLNSCQDKNEASAIENFIVSRLKIGELPIVIIDGLDVDNIAWNVLAQKIVDYPVKILITARNEDWYRYGADLSKVRLKHIEIKLSMAEAQSIFNQFKAKGKIHAGVTNWQDAWENVAGRGLLIEYVYLLTQGSMLRDRLEHQIKSLAKETDASAIFDILRIVAVADCLSIKIKTSNLFKLIGELYHLGTDRGIIIERLNKEYHLQLEDYYISGFHPVRSEHIASLLHLHVPISETLISVFKIIESQYHQLFFSQIKKFKVDDDNTQLFNHLAKIVSDKSFKEIVDTLNGLYEAEAISFGCINKKIFDEVYSSFGIDIFVLDTVPLQKNDFLGGFAESLGDNDRAAIFRVLSKKKDALVPFNKEGSDIYKFATKLAEFLNNRVSFPDQYIGLYDTVSWFKYLGVIIRPAIQIDYSSFHNDIISGKIAYDDAKELYAFSRLFNHESHEKHHRINKDDILSWLKCITNSPTIEEQEGDIFIEYLLLPDMSDVNQESVNRIEVVHAFFPEYNHYRTLGSILPFLDEAICNFTIQSSKKNLTEQALIPNFTQTINRTWTDAIVRPYRSSSSFAWQKEHYGLRVLALDFVKLCARLFEAHIENNNVKLQKVLAEIVPMTQKLPSSFTIRKRWPEYANDNPTPAMPIKDKAMDGWNAPFTSFLSQYPYIFDKSKDKARLAMYNLKELIVNLTPMQIEYDQNMSATYRFFSTQELSNEEQQWYSRLMATIELYKKQADAGFREKIPVARVAAIQWKSERQANVLKHVIEILDNAAEKMPFKFVRPSYVDTEINLSNVVIGIRNFLHGNDNLWLTISGLTRLIETNLQFFYFIFIDDNDNAYRCVRVSIYFLQKFILIEKGDIVDEEYSFPITVQLNEELIRPLQGIKIKKGDSRPELVEKVCRLVLDLWQWLEYRERLASNSVIEKEWLRKIEAQYSQSINESLRELSKRVSHSQVAAYSAFVEELSVSSNHTFKEVIVQKLNDFLTSLESNTIS